MNKTVKSNIIKNTPVSVFSNTPLIAGTFSTWKYRIEIRGNDIEPEGSIKIGYDLRGEIGYENYPQHKDSTGANYYSFLAPKGVKLEAIGYCSHHHGKSFLLQERIESESYFWRDIGKGLISLNLHIAQLKVISGKLKEGDIITITLGDKVKGSPGMTVPCQATDMWRHWVLIQRRKDAKLEVLGEDFLVIHPDSPAAVISVVPTITSPGEKVNVRTTVLDAYSNPVGNVKYKYYFQNRQYKSNDNIPLSKGINRIKAIIPHKKISSFSNPTYYSKNNKLKLFWGDIHGHSLISDGGGRTPSEYYQWARDIMRLDFSALTDHDFGIGLYDSKKNWSVILETTRRFNEDGFFVTLPGWEITHLGLFKGNIYGHKNIYFVTDYPPFYNSSPYGKNRVNLDYFDIEELIQKIKNKNIKFLIIDHTSHGLTDWSRADKHYDRLAEVYAFWGCSEWIDTPVPTLEYVAEEKTSRAGLEQGLQLGFVAGTDTHMAAPANYNETRTFGTSGKVPGLTAVWAKELTREAIFDALWHRRTYATRGSRIFLDFKINGYMVGEKFKLKSSNQLRKINILISGTSPVKTIELINNNRIIKKWKGNKKFDIELKFEHKDVLSGIPIDKNTNYYYVRVLQENGDMAWSSPIWVR